MSYVLLPNLPTAPVTLAILSNEAKNFGDILNKDYGVQTLYVQRLKNISTSVGSHADMACHHLGGKNMLVEASEIALMDQLRAQGFSVKSTRRFAASHYPYDILLNAARVGHKLFGRIESLDPVLLSYMEQEGIKFIPVKQGYAKCSMAIVDTESIITADAAIARTAIKENLDVLKIQEGFIQLTGFSYGFIGGCCGLIDKKCMAFTGNINLHPDADKIKEFLANRQIQSVCLSNSPLVDIGGILPVKQQ